MAFHLGDIKLFFLFEIYTYIYLKVFKVLTYQNKTSITFYFPPSTSFLLLVSVMQRLGNLCYSGFKHGLPYWQCKLIKWFWKTTYQVQRAIQINIPKVWCINSLCKYLSLGKILNIKKFISVLQLHAIKIYS